MKRLVFGNIVIVLLLAASIGHGADEERPLQTPQLSAEYAKRRDQKLRRLLAAAFFCVGPIFVYALAWGMTRRPGASFIAALAYSLVSPCAWLVPVIRTDLGSAWNLRRLQILA